MNRNETARASWIRRLWIGVSTCIGLLVACGGGVGTGGTGAFASGPVSGFGSIIINEVVYDDSLARIEDDTGAGRDRSELRLGSVVEVDSDAVRNGAALASRVRISSERIGRVDAVAANTLTVNGLPVRLNSGTVFDDTFAGGAAGVTVGTLIEVHGFSTDASGEVLATRVEARPTATVFKFRGTISTLDTQARTFRIGSQTFAYTLGVGGRDLLAEGAFLRVWVNPTLDQQGRWVVTAIARGQPVLPDNMEAKAHGVITLFASSGQLPGGRAVADQCLGREHSKRTIGPGPARQGRWARAGRRAGRHRGQGAGAKRQRRAADARQHRFRGSWWRAPSSSTAAAMAVSFARPGLVFENGSAASLTVGRRVTAYGQLSADGTPCSRPRASASRTDAAYTAVAMNRRTVLSAAALAAPALTASAQPGTDIEALQREVWDTEVAFARTMAQRDLAAFERFLSPHTVWWSGQQGTALARQGRRGGGVEAFLRRPAGAVYVGARREAAAIGDGTLATSTGPGARARRQGRGALPLGVAARVGRALVDVLDRGEPADPPPKPPGT